MRNTSLLLFSLFTSSFSFAQNLHLSQFDEAPLLLNPALTGAFSGQHRFAVNYRNQWASITQPFVTMAFGYDLNMVVGKKKEDLLDLGAFILSDKSGDGGLRTTKILASIAYDKHIDEAGKFNIGLGMQTGILLRSVNTSVLTFPDTYNPVSGNFAFDPSDPVSGSVGITPTFNLGAILSFNPIGSRLAQVGRMGSGIHDYEIGVSILNLNAPVQSFLNEESRVAPSFSLYLASRQKLNNQITVYPRILFYKQRSEFELIFGGDIQYTMLETQLRKRNIFTGVYNRFNDAVYFVFGFEYNDYRFAVSYDLNISKLTPVSRTIGAFEFSFIYIINNQNSRINCPKFTKKLKKIKSF